MDRNYDIIYGEHACKAVIENNSRKIFEILITDTKILSQKYLEQHKNIIKIVEKKQLEKIIRIEDKHQGIAMKIGALIEKELLHDLISNMNENEFNYGFILDRVQDPHNIGAIIRSAYCFGASFMIVGKNEAPSINNTIIRASVGCSESLPIYTITNMAREIAKLKELGFWVIGLDSNKASELPEKIIQSYGKKIVFVLGSEGGGMRELTKKECDGFIKIPMIENAESLNVSNAATIVSYEAFIYKKYS